MATFTNIPDTSLARDKPLTQSVARALRDNPLAISDGDGTAPRMKNPAVAKAWVNFNGNGTLSVRSSYNISSVTDVGVGSYRLNFTVPMGNQSYVVVGNCQNWTGSAVTTCVRPTGSSLPSTSACDFTTTHTPAGGFDPEWVAVTVFGNS
jgi:hypothetical protein